MVVVDNSAFIGVQIMYPNPFKSSYDMHNLTISNTESDGIRLESPLVKITDTDVINTKGRGFLSDFNWKPLNIHVLDMAAGKVKRYYHTSKGILHRNATDLPKPTLLHELPHLQWQEQDIRNCMGHPFVIMAKPSSVAVKH